MDDDKELHEILKNFLDATDYALEAPEEQADDKDWFDRPYIEAKEALRAWAAKQAVDNAKELFHALKDVWANPPQDFTGRAEDFVWSADELLKVLDILEKEWLSALQQGENHE